MSGRIRGVIRFIAERADLLVLHPTVKPVAMVADAIKDCWHRGGIILDSCAGSGTTVLAAEQTGRRPIAWNWTRSMWIRPCAAGSGPRATRRTMP